MKTGLSQAREQWIEISKAKDMLHHRDGKILKNFSKVLIFFVTPLFLNYM